MGLARTSILASLVWLSACGGGGTVPAAVPAAPAPSNVPPSQAGWRITVYYTPVVKFYSGTLQAITGCSNLQCTVKNVALGSFPSDFVRVVQTEGTGKVADNRYLNWSGATGFWIDVVPRDAQGHALMPYRSAAADPSVPFGTTFTLQTCGADTVDHTPTASAVCGQLQWQTWMVTDRFEVGAVGQHMDLYIGEQTSTNFLANPSVIDASGASLAITAPSTNAIWKPSPADTLQWILGAALDTSAAASVYDVDGFETNASDIARLHSMRRHAICYINAGAYENWRPDSATFPSQVIGNAYAGWPGESWLDIRRIDLLGPIMQARIDMCKSKGFDAIEPDNIEGYANATGFPLTAADQIVFNSWLASLAHERGLSIALKNDADQIGELQPLYDFALSEDCWNQGWCAQLAPFHSAGEAVFNAEYTDVTAPAAFLGSYCPQARVAGFDAIFKRRQLDAWLQTCP